MSGVVSPRDRALRIMKRVLSRACAMSEFQDYKIGDDSGDLGFASSEDNRLALQAVLERAQRSVEIYSGNLEPRVFDNMAVLDALKRLAIKHRASAVRILLHDPELAIKYGHRIIELGRSLSSSFSFKRTHPEYIGAQAFVIADRRAMLFKQYSDRHEGYLNFNAPRAADDRLRFFDEAWEHSAEILDFKRLHI